MSPAVRAPLVLLLALATLGDRPARAEDGPEGFVVIVASDLGAGELGCYGHPSHATPHLDRLAAEGMRFTMCWATPLAEPSYAMLLTGRYGHRTGHFQAPGRPFSPRPASPLARFAEQVTFAGLLDAQGYATALAGTWELSRKTPTLLEACGFDRWRVRAEKRDLPRGVVHTGAWQDARRRTTSRYWHPCILEDGGLLATEARDYGPDLFASFLTSFVRAHHAQRFLVYYPACLTQRPWGPTPDATKPNGRGGSGLAQNVAYLDRIVGRLVAVLDELGLREKTLILFTSACGTHGAGRGRLTPDGAHVPLIASWKGRVPHATSDALVSLADVMPTLVEWGGASLPTAREIDGESLVPVLTGAREEHRELLYTYLGEGAMARDRRWILDGRGRLLDTWAPSRRGWKDVTDADDETSRAALARLRAFLDDWPGPDAVREQLIQPGERGAERGR